MAQGQVFLFFLFFFLGVFVYKKLLTFFSFGGYLAFKGFSSGVMLSFLCFYYFSVLFERGAFFSVSFGLVAGIVFFALLEYKINAEISFFSAAVLKSALFLAVVFTSLYCDKDKCPFFFGVFMMSFGTVKDKMLFSPEKKVFFVPFFFLLAAGVLFLRDSIFLLSLSGGILLYYFCGDMLGEEARTRKETLLSVGGSLFGFLLGIFLIY